METQNQIPWVTILFKPRKTMRNLISLGSNKRKIFILVLLSVIVEGLKTNNTPFGLPSTSIGYIFLFLVLVVIVLLIGALLGVLVINVCAALLDWTGNWLGGQGDYEEIKLSLAWSNVPIIWSVLIWLVLVYVKSLKPNSIYIEVLTWLDYLIGTWAFVIYLNCLGEAQKFSIWKALLNSILAVLVVVIPIAFLVGVGYFGYQYGLRN